MVPPCECGRASVDAMGAFQGVASLSYISISLLPNPEQVP
jgi:hypothetical protein